MLLSERKRALLYLCLAGMEAAWATPFFLLLFRRLPSVWAAYGVLLGALVAWILVLDLLNWTQVASPLYQIVVLGVIAITSLAILVLSPGAHARPGGFAGMLDFRGGIATSVALALTNLFLWQRATSATSRDISFFSVGVSFRLGLLLLVIGGSIAGAIFWAPGRPVGANLLPLLWLYFGFGLAAVAMARVEEKASEAQSAGRSLPLRRIVQLLLAIGVTLALAGLLSRIYTAQNLGRLLALFVPLWRLVRPVAVAVASFLLKVLSPLFEWLVAWLRAIFEMGWTELQPVQVAMPPAEEVRPGILERLPSSLTAALGHILLVLGILVAAGLIIGFFLLYLDRVRRRSQARVEEEEEGAEPVTMGAGMLERGAQTLRDLAGLVRRFGVSRQLLAAVSVQNIYANLCRLARQRGYPRPPAQPPDVYLPALSQAFAGHDEALERITAAYMRVHYGDRAVSMDELAALRADYRAVRESETR
jgi:Domain of unknown function (DUF4129)